MQEKVAVFVDWENVRLEIQNIQRTHKDREKIIFNYNNIDNILKLFDSVLQENEKLYRTFFYSAEPLSLNDLLKNSSKNSHIYNAITKFRDENLQEYEKMEKLRGQILKLLHDISVSPYIALRLGELKMQGFTDRGKPNIVQKQVDMLMGLDISHVSYKRLVDKIIVFCKDTDIVPALKCARTNGIEVIVVDIAEGYKIGNKILKHSDCVREISLLEKFSNQGI